MEPHEHHDHDHDHHHHHEGGLTSMAISATLHCLFGCALGEIAGLALGTALGFSNFATIVLAIALAFVFGYSLTSLPILRAGMTLAAVAPIAFASDTLSIATMEIVDNLIVVVIPGAMDAGLGDLLFWGALSVALVIAGVFAVPVNRYLLARGKGHAVVHETGIHGGPSPRLVGAIAIAAAIFGTTVLIADGLNGDAGHGGAMAMKSDGGPEAGHEGGTGGPHAQAGHGAASEVRGLTPEKNGLRLVLERKTVDRSRPTTLAFRIDETAGGTLKDFETIHERKMHLIVVRTNLLGFQHLHPKMSEDGTWRTPPTLLGPGEYRVYADFQHDGEPRTLGDNVTVGDPSEAIDPPTGPTGTEATVDGYHVRLVPGTGRLDFEITRGGEPVTVEPYLGAGGHLVAIRKKDLGFLHVHPTGDKPEFEVELKHGERYRLFLQFKARGRVHTAAFWRG